MSSIKAICFDLDGVYFTHIGKASFHRALSEEFKANPEKVDSFMSKDHPTMYELVRGIISNQAFFDEMLKYLGINQTNEEITERWVRDYSLDERVQQVVLSVKEQGYLTCVCTNNNDIRLSALERRFGFLKDFDVVVSSHIVAECKPSTVIYQELLNRLGIEPGQLVYADDNPDNIKGASGLGINAFLFENFEQYLAELEKVGVSLR